ncbi:SMC family ATPase [Macrococcoides goetzii]|uniref:Nuclease SbcCD subunit C n=1 Tax=Macrococcoides goetzii TaxID=1891097 RepID=A0A2G5NSD2_9STAP|nr:SMC family ATPase [Macrococcus goetzii]RAI82712.1 SMC family ATPase [Macrococcus goetzii]
MRPNTLTLKAFGPFKEETIDFKSLQNHQLFLISGKTGAGKTTIFDGMMYALFGVASTSDREESNLRNINAQDDEPTEVIYNFYMQGKQYEIYRDIPFIKNGNKTKKSTQLNVYEIDANEKRLLASGLTAGKEKIKDIIKLDAHQFRKIFILPQGEFKSLLVSGSKEKSDILRTLFDTTNIQKLSAQLREKVQQDQNEMLALESEIGVQLAMFNGLIDQNVSKTYTDKHDAIQSALLTMNDEIEKSKKTLEIKRNLLKEKEKEVSDAEILNDSIIQLKNHEAERSRLMENEKNITDKQSDLKHLIQFDHYKMIENDLFSHINKSETVEQNIKHLNIQFQEIEKRLKVLRKQQETFQQSYEDITEKKKYVIQNERYTHSKYKNLQQDINENKEKITTLTNKIESLQEKVNDAQNYEREKQLIHTQVLENDSKISTLDNTITKVKMQISTLSKFTKQLDRLLSTKESYQNIDESIKSLKSKLNDLQSSEKVQDVEQIENIKSQLNVGDKCPVCANVIHNLDDTSHIEAHKYQIELEQMKQRQQKLSTSIEIYINELEMISSITHIYDEDKSKFNTIELGALNEWIDNITIENIGNAAYLAFYEQIQAIYVQLSQQQKRADDELQELKNVNLKYQEQLNTLDAAQDEKVQLVESLKLIQEEVTVVEKQYHRDASDFSKFLQDTNTDGYMSFTERYNNYKAEISTYESYFEQCKENIAQDEKEKLLIHQNVESLNRQKEELVQSIQLYNERIEQYQIPEAIKLKYTDKNISVIIEQFEKEIKAFHDKRLTLSNEIERLTQIIDNRESPNLDTLQQELETMREMIDGLVSNVGSMQEKYQNYTNQFIKLEDRLTYYESTMKDVRSLVLLSDALNGNNAQKIDIETYVLMYYLEQTLLLANNRLRQMTGNRYELRRRAEKRGGGRQGLVIDVFDYNANNTRNISSLSGGETFIASLCLALGLSDFVMQISGGIHLESVFIDEGFGTLDDETLEVAVNALIDLQTSGKLVGMISHVQLLKERIPAILKIESNGFDSSATFIIQ